MLSTECLGVSALFWSHIIAVHSVATIAERVVGGDVETLAGWRKLFQRFQLAHLLIICVICRAWNHWFWLCTSVCTLMRIMGLLLCVVSDNIITTVVSKAVEPRTSGCHQESDDSKRPSNELNIKCTVVEGHQASAPNDGTSSSVPLQNEASHGSTMSTLDDSPAAKLRNSEGDAHDDETAASSSVISLTLETTSDDARRSINARSGQGQAGAPSRRRGSLRQSSRLALLRSRAAKPSSARQGSAGDGPAVENCKIQSSETSSSDGVPHRAQDSGIGIEQPQPINIPLSAVKRRATLVVARSSAGRPPVRPSSSMTDLSAATFGLDLSSMEIMVVEDDRVQQVVVEKFLTRHGLKAVCVDCGEDAISLLEERERNGGQDAFPGMILMDLMMPGLNGHETTEKIRKLFPTAALPIIMLTGDESEETVVEAVRRGANDIMTKTRLKGCLIARIAAQLSTLRFWRSKLDAQKNEQLLHEILPVSVIQRLNEGPRLIYDEHAEVSIVFTDIVGFTDLASSVPTRDLIEMLDKLFNTFDTLCDKHGVYKVETIGDAYMVVAGHEASSQGDHAIRTVQMAADMVAAASCMTMPNGQPLKIRAGVHSGPAFSGVVGWKRPRFCMFGDTVNVASRMESTSFSSCVQLSSGTHECYTAQQQNMSDVATRNILDFQCLGARDIKGKGAMTTFLAKVGDWEEAVLSIFLRLQKNRASHSMLV